MRKGYPGVIILCVCLCGCAVTYEQYEIVEDPDPGIRRFISTRRLQTGLTREEAAAVLGDKIIVGYEMPDTRRQHYKPIVQENPRRVENYRDGQNVYIIDYYFIGINRSDGQITDDELTPLVFQDDRLIGWGWEFLNKLKK